jgi:hypothetical protein
MKTIAFAQNEFASMLRANAGGPFMLTRVSPGRYEVEATFAGKTPHENVQVRHGHAARRVLVWPVGTAEPHW